MPNLNVSILESTGLSSTAARLYLAALARGTASVQQLAQQAKIKRPTAYNYLQELIHAGWLEKVPVGKKEYYRATNPTSLVEHTRKNVTALEQSLPELVSVYNQHSTQPAVSIFEGNRAIEQLHRGIAQANTIRFWSDLSQFERLFPDAADQLSSEIAKNQITTKEIIVNTSAAKRSAKRYAAVAGKYYSCRLATKGNIFNNSVVYNHTVLLFRLQEHNLAVVRIDDAAIAETFKTMFDLAWQSAEKFIPR